MDFKELFTLGGKIALVTGAARGLGREISLGLAQSGASLVLADVVYPQETAELVEQSGMRCLAVQTDISDESQVKDLTKMAVAEYQRVDLLVNNAGVSQLSCFVFILQRFKLHDRHGHSRRRRLSVTVVKGSEVQGSPFRVIPSMYS